MQRTDIDGLRELLSNMHALGCRALEDEVLAHPDWCDCNVKEAEEILERIVRTAEVASGDAPLDAVELTFSELTARIAKLERHGWRVVEKWPHTQTDDILQLKRVLKP